MKPLRRLLPALLFPLTSILACGSDDEEGLTSAQFAAEYCALYRPCCQEAGLPAQSQQACSLLFGLMPITDAGAAQQCLDEWKERAKAPNFCDLTGGLGDESGPESCKRAFPQSTPGTPATGTAPPGASCDFTSDCAPSARGEVSCHHSFDTGTSYCQVAVSVTEGAACAATREENVLVILGDDSGPELPVCVLANGLYCDGSACKAVTGIGGDCTSSQGCADGFCSSGICTAHVPAGSPCVTSSDACDDQSYCDFADQTCRARVAEGSACETSEQCLTGLCIEGKCGPFNPGSFGLLLFCS